MSSTWSATTWLSSRSRHGIQQARLEVEDQLVVEPVHVQVGLHFGLGVDERGVAALARL